MTMDRSHITKKKPSDISRRPLKTIAMSSEDWEEFSHGVSLFNEGKFWHAHEAWEEVWRRHEEDERLFFQGLIQLAAAYHHLSLKKSFRGLVNNFSKSYEILKAFQPDYLGIPVESVLRGIEEGKKEAEKLGPEEFAKLNPALILQLQFQRPPDPDLQVGICGLLESDEFLEGAKMFNERYYWEAHEIWDRLRQDHEGDTRTFTEGLTQMACAYHFLQRKKYQNVVYLLEKAANILKSFEQQACDYPLARLIESMNTTREAILRQNHDHAHEVAQPLIPVPEKKTAAG